MSADNGIYIAKFTDGFRVIHALAIDNLTYYPENSWEYNEEIKNYFHNAKRFDTEDEAVKFAWEYSKTFDILEYGICDLGNLPKTW